MERKKMTKALIGKSLKVLMRNHPFEKITIKMITDEAGVIRPTFYNYFCDKYEVVEWIFNEYIIEKVRAMFEQKMYTEGLKLLFVCMKNDCAFYRKAFEITGQNALVIFFLSIQNFPPGCMLNCNNIRKYNTKRKKCKYNLHILVIAIIDFRILTCKLICDV